MRIINNRTVDLTVEENRAHIVYDDLLDRGHDVPTCARRVEELYPGLDPAFYRWLRGDPLMPPVKSRLVL